jgi:branched-chain amino acid transport system substrate-binding protein
MNAQYIITDGFWSMDFPYPGAKELGKRYHSHFGNYSVSVGTYYALAQILLQAIEKAGTLDGAEVRQAVLDNQFQTVRGPVKYKKNGIASFSSIACQWWNGKQELVYPTALAYWRTKLAPDWDHSQSVGLAKEKPIYPKKTEQ